MGRPCKVNAVAVVERDGTIRTYGQLVAAGVPAQVSNATIFTWRHRGAELATRGRATLTAEELALVEVYEALGAPQCMNGLTVNCNQCGTPFTNRHGSRYCSDACRRAFQSARLLSLYWEAVENGLVRRGMVFFRAIVDYLAERDGTECGICGDAVDITLKSGPLGDRQGPSLDHVIPRSQGGPDTLVNLRLTHWACNHRRGNRGGNEQLALIG